MPHLYSLLTIALHRWKTLLLLLLITQGTALAQTISSFSPSSGAPGTVVTITGANLTGTTGVTFNGVLTTGLTVVNSTTLTTYVPVGATTGPLVAAKATGSGTSATNFTVLDIPPAVQVSVTPAGPLNACTTPTLTAVASAPQFLPAGSGTNGRVFATVLQPDGKVLVCGYFDRFNSSTRGGVLRLNADGTLDASFAPAGTGFNSDVRCIALQPDGKVLVGGYFTSYNGTPVAHLARLNTTGTLDATFIQSGTGFDGFVEAITVQPDGRIVVGGSFTNYNSNLRVALARLNANGTLDTSFVLPGSGIVGTVGDIIAQPDGRLLISGYLQTLNNVSRGSIIRLNADGSLDTSFASTNGVVSSTVLEMVRQPDGKIVAVAGFTSSSGGTVGMGRLNANGTRDATFAPTGFGFSGGVYGLALQPDGRIVAGGTFTSYNGIVRNRLGRLNANGTLDTSFAAAGTGLNSDVYDVALQPDGKVIAVGAFTTFDGIAHSGIVRVNADGTLDAAASTFPSATYVWSPTGSTGATVVAASGGSYQTTATVNGYAYLSNTVTVTGCIPTLTSFSPSSGPVGTSLTINGTNLTGTTLIIFAGASGNTVSTGYAVNAAGTQITGVVVPFGAQTGTLTVTTPGGSATSTGIFTVTVLAPTITSFTPTSGPAGTTVTINGTNLGGTSTIAFGGTGTNTVTSGYTVNAAGTQIIGVVVPSGAQTGPISATTPAGTAASTTNFTVPGPTLTTISPNSGPVGTSVTLTGNNLSGTAQVSFNGTMTSSFISNSATQIVLTVPNGATTGPVTVTTPAGTSNAVTFTVVTCPPTTIAYGTTTYCQTASTNPVPTVTGPAGGSFTSATGLTLNSTTGVITLASSTPGTYTITYAGGPVTCTASTQVTITAAPSAAFIYGAPAYCQAAGTTITPTLGSNATAGTFSAIPAGLTLNSSTGALDLANSLPGTYTVTNALAANNDCAATSATAQVVINALPVPTVTASGPATFCQGGSVMLTANGGTSYLWSTGATTASITVSASGSYTVAVTNAAGCTATSAATMVTVNPSPTATFTYSGAIFCQSGIDPTPNITGTTGGTFTVTPTGLSIDATTGAINLAASTAGSYAVTYVVAATCPASTTVSVTITNAPSPSFTYAAANSCAGSTGTLTPTFGAGSSAGAFAATPAGLTINAATGVVALSTSTAGTYTITNSIAAAGGCAIATVSQALTINAVPVATLAAGGPTTFCEGGSVVLTAPAGTGNTYQFFNGATSLGAAAATNTLTATTSGAYTVVVTNAATCQATSVATTVTVNPQTTAAFSYIGSPFCQSNATNPAPAITGTAGGAFSSTTGLSINATTGLINLGASTPGTYIVAYDVSGPCSSSATQSVTITAPASAAFSYPGAGTCAGSAGTLTPALGSGAMAGTFSVNPATGLSIDATTGTVNLATSTPGTYTVINTVAAANGCAAVTNTAVLVVNPAPVANAGPAQIICSGGTAQLGAASVAGTTYSYTPATGLSNASIANPMVTLTNTTGAPIAQTYTVTATSANGCVATATTTVTVNPIAVAAFSYGSTGTLCANGTTAPVVLGTGATAGTFTSTAGLTLDATTGAITPSTSTPGTYTVTNTVPTTANQCGSTATTLVTITTAPTASFSYPAATTYCAGSASTVVPTLDTGASAGVFGSTAGLTINATTGEITLATSTAGTYTVTNTIAASGACSVVTATSMVTITPAASATFTYSGATFCVSGTTAPIATVTGTTGGTFSSATGLTLNATTGTITLASSTPGTYTVTYVVAGTCGASSTQNVTITGGQAATFSYANASACAGSATLLVPTLGTGAAAGTFTSTTGLTINAATGAVNPATSVAGNYTVTNTIAATGGCAAATSTATVTINALPTTPTYTYTYPTPSTVLFTSSAAPAGTTYQWFLGSVAITGATSQTYTANGTTAPGTYTVRFINTATGCQSAASTPLTVTATSQAQAGSSLTLFPNPTADGQLSLQLSGYAKAVTLTVIDALGRVVLTQQVSAGQSEARLNLSRAASGVYMLRAVTEGGIDVRRIVRE